MTGEDRKTGLDSLRDSDDLEAQSRPAPGPGRPRSRAGSTPLEVMSRLLSDDGLSYDEGPGRGVRRITENRQGLQKGYDPYESGMLSKKDRHRKRDLRALSAWIAAKKRARPDDE